MFISFFIPSDRELVVKLYGLHVNHFINTMREIPLIPQCQTHPYPPISPPIHPSLPSPALHISYTDTLSSWTGTSDSMEFTQVSTCFFRKGGRATGNEKDELVLLVNITPSFLHWRTTQLKQTASCPGRDDIIDAINLHCASFVKE